MLFGVQVTFNWGKGLAQCLNALWRVVWLRVCCESRRVDVWFDVPCMLVTVHIAELIISGDYEHKVKLKQSLALAEIAARGAGDIHRGVSTSSPP